MWYWNYTIAIYGFCTLNVRGLLPSKAKALFTVNSLRSRDISNIVSSLSNNLIDFDTPIHVVKGFQGDNLEELQTNLKTKK